MTEEVELTNNISLKEANLEDIIVNWAIYDRNLPINGIEMKFHVKLIDTREEADGCKHLV